MTNNSRDRSTGFFQMLMTFLAGMGLGYIVSLFVGTETKKEHKRKIEEAAERAREVFAENTAEMRAKYESIRSEFTSALTSLKTTVKNIDKKKYADVLNKVLGKVQEDKDLTQDQIGKLRDYFTSDFEKIKASLSRD